MERDLTEGLEATPSTGLLGPAALLGGKNSRRNGMFGYT
jgi:hypothetical protein